MALTIEEARTRVARGAARLDEVRPGWHDRIDIGTLTLSDPCQCVIGQLVGNFNSTHLDELFPMDRQQCRNGRFFPSTHYFGINAKDSPKTWARLQEAWVQAIADRRLRAGLVEIHQPAQEPVCQ